MADLIIKLRNKTLKGMGKEASNAELGCSLKDLATDSGLNYAVFKRDGTTPTKSITILPQGSVPPAGGAKICDGKLTIGAAEIGVTAYRV